MRWIVSSIVLLTVTAAVEACPTCGDSTPMPVDANNTQVVTTGFNKSILLLVGGVTLMAGLVGVTVYGAAKSSTN